MKQNGFLFEVCANSVESCVAAQEGGAHRVELCAGIPEGGTTPSYGEIKAARKVLRHTQLNVIIRPRGGDFTYSPEERSRMADDIDMCRKLRVDGVVFGCLTADGWVNIEHCMKLLEHCQGIYATFHRAFDRCSDPFEDLERLIAMGFDRVLTSGFSATAEQGVAQLARLHETAAGRIGVVAGGGVNEHNIAAIYEQTGVRQFHFSAREKFLSPVSYMGGEVYMGEKDVDEAVREVTTVEKVQRTISALVSQK